MSLILVEPPSSQVMSLAELGDHVRLSHGFTDAAAPDAGAGSADDAALKRALDAATAAIERSLSTALLRQTWEWRFLTWPGRDRDRHLARLPISPVLSVVSVEWVAADGAATAWSASAWRLDASGPWLRAVDGVAPCPPQGGGVVRFQAGYGDAPADVPADLRQAAALLAAHYFERRSNAEPERLERLSDGVERLLAPHRRLRV